MTGTVWDATTSGVSAASRRARPRRRGGEGERRRAAEQQAGRRLGQRGGGGAQEEPRVGRQLRQHRRRRREDEGRDVRGAHDDLRRPGEHDEQPSAATTAARAGREPASADPRASAGAPGARALSLLLASPASRSSNDKARADCFVGPGPPVFEATACAAAIPFTTQDASAALSEAGLLAPGSSSGRTFPPASWQWLLAAFVPGHSGGSAPVLHRLPSSGPRGHLQASRMVDDRAPTTVKRRPLAIPPPRSTMMHRIEPRGWTMARRPLTRAEFLKILAAGAGGIVFLRGSEDALAGITGVDDDLDQAALDGDAGRGAAIPYMTVVHGTPVGVNVKTAIAKLGGMRRFVGNGDDVIIKPNICAARKPELAATTNPVVVATLVRLARGAGASRVRVMDNPITPSSTCYSVSGIASAVRAAGGSMQVMSGSRYKTYDIPGGKLKRQPVYRDMVECDVLINVAYRQAARVHRAHPGRQERHGLHQRPRPHAHPGPQPHDRRAERLPQTEPDGPRRDPHPGAERPDRRESQRRPPQGRRDREQGLGGDGCLRDPSVRQVARLRPVHRRRRRDGPRQGEPLRPRHQEVRGLTRPWRTSARRPAPRTSGRRATTRDARRAAGRAAGEPPAGRGAPSRSSRFAVFVYLLFAGLQRLTPQPYANVFFRFDPLAALATMLAARAWLAPFALAFITLGVTLALGRVWCGWICPMGTLLGWLRFRSARRMAGDVPAAVRRVKYVLLGVVVVLAALANLTLLVLDPLSLLTRTVTTSVLPGFVYVVDTLERAGMAWGPTVGLVGWVEEHFRGSVLPTIQPRYEQAVGLFLLLLVLILLNAVADRFWCRYLCPLGALLGLVSKVQLLRPVMHDACGACGACATACRLDAIEVGGGGASSGEAAKDVITSPPTQVVSSECTMCLDCLVACPREDGVTLGPARPGPWADYDPGRREAVLAVGAGLATAVLLGAGRRSRRQAPGPDPAAGRPGRRPVPLSLPTLRRMHEGLPHVGPSADAGGGRSGRSLDTRPQVAPRVLRLRVPRLRTDLPLGRDPSALATERSAPRSSASP